MAQERGIKREGEARGAAVCLICWECFTSACGCLLSRFWGGRAKGA